MGIERFIHLTTVNTSLDVDLMIVALKLCYKSINSFQLSFGLISIKLRDITILTGLRIRCADALCLLDVQDSSLPAIEFSSTIKTSYSSTIRKWHDVTGIPSIAEQVEFLWVLLCRYVFFHNSGKLAMEYLPLAKTIALGQPYA